MTEHIGAREIRRLAYLEALGIDGYVSRRALPGAADSRRLRLLSAAPQPASSPIQKQPVLPQRSVSPVAELLADTNATPAPRSRQESAPARAVSTPASSADVPVFSVAATFAGGWYWIDEITAGRSVGAEYLQLIQAICHAMRLSTDAPVQEQFNWPLGGASQLDQGTDAARAAFSGFLTGRIERFQPARVVLLGAPDSQWFEASLLPADAKTVSVSGWRMLRQPELKRQAWGELKALAGDAN